MRRVTHSVLRHRPPPPQQVFQLLQVSRGQEGSILNKMSRLHCTGADASGGGSANGVV